MQDLELKVDITPNCPPELEFYDPVEWQAYCTSDDKDGEAETEVLSDIGDKFKNAILFEEQEEGKELKIEIKDGKNE